MALPCCQRKVLCWRLTLGLHANLVERMRTQIAWVPRVPPGENHCHPGHRGLWAPSAQRFWGWVFVPMPIYDHRPTWHGSGFVVNLHFACVCGVPCGGRTRGLRGRGCFRGWVHGWMDETDGGAGGCALCCCADRRRAPWAGPERRMRFRGAWKWACRRQAKRSPGRITRTAIARNERREGGTDPNALPWNLERQLAPPMLPIAGAEHRQTIAHRVSRGSRVLTDHQPQRGDRRCRVQ